IGLHAFAGLIDPDPDAASAGLAVECNRGVFRIVCSVLQPGLVRIEPPRSLFGVLRTQRCICVDEKEKTEPRRRCTTNMTEKFPPPHRPRRCSSYSHQNLPALHVCSIAPIVPCPPARRAQ